MTPANPYAQETLANLLQGKVIIVTGGNSGIGQSIVEEVARLGAKVVIDYRSHPEATEAIERELGDLGGSCIGVQADVSKLEDLQRLVQEAVNRYGRLDVMVNNTPYCVAKGDVRMLTRTAGVELASKGVSIVNVGPGAVATPINDSCMNNPELLAKLNAASYITATSIFADGGIMQSSPGL